MKFSLSALGALSILASSVGAFELNVDDTGMRSSTRSAPSGTNGAYSFDKESSWNRGE